LVAALSIVKTKGLPIGTHGWSFLASLDAVFNGSGKTGTTAPMLSTAVLSITLRDQVQARNLVFDSFLITQLGRPVLPQSSFWTLNVSRP
jgi:hypothetical protein